MPLLQHLFSGGKGGEQVPGLAQGLVLLRKTLVTSRGQELLRSELDFLQPGGSITATVMYLASREWYFALGTAGVAAVSRFAQDGTHRHHSAVALRVPSFGDQPCRTPSTTVAVNNNANVDHV